MEDAFGAIDNGGKLRRPDELPFDICFGGRRQFCNSNYADLGMFFSFLNIYIYICIYLSNFTWKGLFNEMCCKIMTFIVYVTMLK